MEKDNNISMSSNEYKNMMEKILYLEKEKIVLLYEKNLLRQALKFREAYDSVRSGCCEKI